MSEHTPTAPIPPAKEPELLWHDPAPGAWTITPPLTDELRGDLCLTGLIAAEQAFTAEFARPLSPGDLRSDLRAALEFLGVSHAGRGYGPCDRRWSGSDLATDLAPLLEAAGWVKADTPTVVNAP